MGVILANFAIIEIVSKNLKLNLIFVLTIICSMFLVSCGKKERGLRPDEKSIDAQIEEIIESEKELSDIEINEYFNTLAKSFRKIYLTDSHNTLRHKKDVLELLFHLKNNKLQYFNYKDKEKAGDVALDILKTSIRKIRFMKKNEFDFSHMYQVNYYADASVFLDKSYLKDYSKKLFSKVLNHISNPEGFFLYKQEDSSYPDMDDNSYALATILKLYRVTLDIRYLEKASRLAEQIIDKLGGDQVNLDLVNSLLYLYNFTNDSYWLDTSRALADLILDDKEDVYFNIQAARYMNFLYYFLDEPKYRTFAEEVFERTIKDDIKYESFHDYNILLLKRELEREPIYLKLLARDLDSKDAGRLLEEFLDYKTNFFLLNLKEGSSEAKAKVCINKQCSEYFTDDDDLEEYLSSI